MRRASSIWLMAFLCLVAASASAADLYVAPNGDDHGGKGTRQKPWRTLTRAAGSVKPGDVVHVTVGTYNEQVLVTASGAADAHVRFVCEIQRMCKVVGQNYSGRVGKAAFALIGDYLDVENFEITTDGQGSHGVLGYGATGGYRIIGNYIHDIPAPGCTSDGGAGIDPEGSSNPAAGHAYVAGNLILNIGPPGCKRTHGIYTSGDGDVIVNNVVHNAQGQCISAYHIPRNQVIAFNTLDGCRNGGVVYGSDGTNGIQAGGSIIVNNIISNNGIFGIQECCNSSYIGTNTYDHNLIYGNPKACLMLKGECSNTIARDPRFVDSPHDFHLQPGSPAAGAASAQAVPAVDHDSRSRSGRNDLGAYRQ